MPLLEFHCPACDQVFEELVRSADNKSLVTCPGCGGRNVSRRVSVFAARVSAGRSDRQPAPGACGRCGDPNGPCADR